MAPAKAKTILRDGSVRGHPLSDAQKGLFGAIAGRDNNCRYDDGEDYDDARPKPKPYPRDRFGNPVGVMQPISMGNFTHGRWGYKRRGG